MPPLSNPVEEARRIMEAAESRRLTLRLFGGMSFLLRCPSAKHRSLQRDYADIDFMGYARQSKEIKQLFSELGYAPRDRFNAMLGYKRLIFNDIENQRRVDIFLDVFEMCHKFSLRDRLEVDSVTIPLADMLATKLQIIEVNEKDLKDMLSILLDYDIGTDDENTINGAYLARLCSDDWGIYKTFTLNLDRLLSTLPERDLDPSQKEAVKSRIESLRRMVETAPKSLRWRMRAKIGERMQWYELPEADREVVDSRIAASNPRSSG
jgi:hypothetical protein